MGVMSAVRRLGTAVGKGRKSALMAAAGVRAPTSGFSGRFANAIGGVSRPFKTGQAVGRGISRVRRIGGSGARSVRDKAMGGYSSAAYNTRGFVRKHPKKLIAGGIGLGAVGGAETYRRKRNRRSF